jgi:hypothetical protein
MYIHIFIYIVSVRKLEFVLTLHCVVDLNFFVYFVFMLNAPDC